MPRPLPVLAALALLLAAPGPSWAHGDPAPVAADAARPAATYGEALVRAFLDRLVPPAGAAARVTLSRAGAYRLITADGLPDHATGAFPNAGNPNRIRAQAYRFRVPAEPQRTGRALPLGRQPFGVALNGVVFDPGTAEYWRGDRNSGWRYEAMGGAVSLGLDDSNAHVQPTGAYHYHAAPLGLMAGTGYETRPVLIGYAADGFPIYTPFGHRDPMDPSSPMMELTASYRLKPGTRPDGPGGPRDGSFVEDYRYVPGAGLLDECNGREGVTPEYPQGTYHYVVTFAFPFIPRCFMGTPDDSFRRRGPARTGGPGGRPEGPGGPRRQPPQAAIDACAGRSDGDPCRFAPPGRGALSGLCRTLPPAGRACVPDR
ncbi:MAG: YHYH protein [Rhodobacterales bacterium]|nr:YHYH protein [Rhodobacterales bacterium]